MVAGSEEVSGNRRWGSDTLEPRARAPRPCTPWGWRGPEPPCSRALTPPQGWRMRLPQLTGELTLCPWAPTALGARKAPAEF